MSITRLRKCYWLAGKLSLHKSTTLTLWASKTMTRSSGSAARIAKHWRYLAANDAVVLTSAATVIRNCS